MTHRNDHPRQSRRRGRRDRPTGAYRGASCADEAQPTRTPAEGADAHQARIAAHAARIHALGLDVEDEEDPDHE